MSTVQFYTYVCNNVLYVTSWNVSFLPQDNEVYEAIDE